MELTAGLIFEEHSRNNQSEVVHTIQKGNDSNYCLFVMLHFTNNDNVAPSHRDNNISLNHKSSIYYVLNTLIISLFSSLLLLHISSDYVALPPSSSLLLVSVVG
jgi:hypothetical protein